MTEGFRVMKLEEAMPCADSIITDTCDLNVVNEKHLKLPKEPDSEIARLKLETMGIEIDVLTEEQVKYLFSWQSGT